MTRMDSERVWLGVPLQAPPARAYEVNGLITLVGMGVYAGFRASLGLAIQIEPVWVPLCFAALTLWDFGFHPLRVPLQTVLMLGVLIGLAQTGAWLTDFLRGQGL